MSLTRIALDIQKAVKQNAPVILTSVGVSGVLSTAYLAGRASWYAARRMESKPPIETMTKREVVEEVWDLYIPAAISGVIAVGCIIGANHVSSKRAAAAYSVLAISEKALSDYREKVIEHVGEKKEKALRDELAQDRISSNPPGQLVIAGTGTILCCELFTGRYFNSDMESLRKAQNDVNARLMNDMYVTLGEFYNLIDLPHTSYSNEVGWQSSKQLELRFSTVMSDDSRPCIAFEYSYISTL